MTLVEEENQEEKRNRALYENYLTPLQTAILE